MGKVLFTRMFDKVNVLDRMIIEADKGVENDWFIRAGDGLKPLLRATSKLSRSVSGCRGILPALGPGGHITALVPCIPSAQP